MNTTEALSGKTAVALYFSAHWCPPCRGFTPQLAGWYTSDLKAKGLEVVFVTGDRDEAAFNEYFGEQPWLALPYGSDVIDGLNTKFKVQGIPCVVILDGEGNLMTKDGRSSISADPTGEEMPWKPKTLHEILDGAKLVDKSGSELDAASTLRGQVFAFYFSAHWCPPCRGFTPQLAEWYTSDLKAKGLEVVFVSSDKDEAAFNEYYAEQPWLALSFADRKRKEQLSTICGVGGIPSLVIVDTDGSFISKEGRGAISNDPTGEEFPWHPKPVKNLAQGPGNVNGVPTVVAFCETCSNATEVEAAMTPLAAQYIDEAKAAGEEDPKIGFIIVTSAAGMSSRIRTMMSMEALPPALHQHPLEKKSAGGGWGCDGCGGHGEERFRCTQGCDFDYCGECNAKAGSASEAKLPKLMLVDIPDNGAYYEGPEGEVTEATVQTLVNNYLAKTLERKQLG